MLYDLLRGRDVSFVCPDGISRSPACTWFLELLLNGDGWVIVLGLLVRGTSRIFVLEEALDFAVKVATESPDFFFDVVLGEECVKLK